ncbi:MAG: ATP-dependent zinc protease [Phycisphaerales bacterium JB059]
MPGETTGGPGRIIGRREWVELPEWGIARLRAKVDTGARTSAIHVSSIEDLEGGRLRFEVVRREKPHRRTVIVEADHVREARVRPSTGRTQRRPVVRTVGRIGSWEREIEMTLVCREGMLCRMLLGRRALTGLLVDPSRKDVLGGAG